MVEKRLAAVEVMIACCRTWTNLKVYAGSEGQVVGLFLENPTTTLTTKEPLISSQLRNTFTNLLKNNKAMSGILTFKNVDLPTVPSRQFCKEH